MNDRLLNAFLAGSIDELTFNAKLAALRDEAAQIEERLGNVATLEPPDVRAALAVFEFSQNVPDLWRGSKMLEKRRILEALSLNRMLGDVTLVLEKRKPFDELAKRPLVTTSRDGAHRFEQMETLATTCVRAYPADRPPQLRFLARLVSDPGDDQAN